ncbi:MAG: hypothetical protein ACF8QF_04610 [Phycisphaerales bacterium]
MRTIAAISSHGALAQQGGATNWSMVGVAVAAAIVVAILVAMIASAASRRAAARRAGANSVDADQPVVELQPIPDATAALRSRYADLPTLSRMRGKVKSAYAADLNGRALTIFHHNLTTMAGSTPVVIDHTVYACEAPDWPTVKIAPRRFFSRIALKLGKASGVLLENDDFNRAFWVGTDDEPFAVTLLSPEMQAFLLERPDLRWRIRNREVILIYRGPLKPKRMGASLSRLRRFWSLVPPELDAWTARYGDGPQGAHR